MKSHLLERCQTCLGTGPGQAAVGNLCRQDGSALPLLGKAAFDLEASLSPW